MTDNARLSDDDLLRRTAAADEQAFTVLYRRHQGRVYRYALQMLGSASLAEEVTQEVFLVLMREAASFDPVKGSVQAFLYGISRNYVLRCLDRERTYVPMRINDDGQEDEVRADAGLEFGLAQPASDPLADLTQAESIERLRRAVLALPVNYREAVVLCDLSEMSYLEAASALGCAVGTVRSRLHRGRALLISKLRPKKSVIAAPDTEHGVDQRAAGGTAS